MNTATLCSVIVVTLFAFTSLEAVTGPDTRIINMPCNNAQFTEGSPFADALKIIWNYTTGYYGAYPFLAKSCETSFFLEADCRQGLGGDGCNNCFRVIQHDINVMCTYNMGVQATLSDCKLRYETYSFDQINEKLPTCTLGDAFVLSEDLK